MTTRRVTSILVICLLGIGLIFALTRQQEKDNQFFVTLVDVDGITHQLDLRQGDWYFARTETPWFYVEYQDQAQQLVGWSMYWFYDHDGWSQDPMSNVHRLPTHVEHDSLDYTLADVEAEIGREIWAAQCGRVIRTWGENSEWRMEHYPDFTYCNLSYPDPTLPALKELDLPEFDDLFWSAQAKFQENPDTLVLGDDTWSGEWKFNETYFSDRNERLMAFWRYGACDVSIIGDDGGYYQVPESAWSAHYIDQKWGGEYIEIELIEGWRDLYRVNELSALDCMPSSDFSIYYETEDPFTVSGS